MTAWQNGRSFSPLTSQWNAVMPPCGGIQPEYVAMVRHKALEELEVSGRGFLGLAEYDLSFADCDFRKNFSGGGVRDREVGNPEKPEFKYDVVQPSAQRRVLWRHLDQQVRLHLF